MHRISRTLQHQRCKDAYIFDVAQLRDPSLPTSDHSEVSDRSAPRGIVFRQLSTIHLYLERHNLACTPSPRFKNCQTLRETTKSVRPWTVFSYVAFQDAFLGIVGSVIRGPKDTVNHRPQKLIQRHFRLTHLPYVLYNSFQLLSRRVELLNPSGHESEHPFTNLLSLATSKTLNQLSNLPPPAFRPRNPTLRPKPPIPLQPPLVKPLPPNILHCSPLLLPRTKPPLPKHPPLNLSTTSSNEKTRSTNVTIHNCEGDEGYALAAAAMRVKVEAPT
ncbi:hypothetical protein CFIO01_02260 [Colletotrichum fioriniae PJ7]|uniref:Uncharacterized protein n=1 Tax=Colletotrichum fioriniae PJ7 TaxID=1445577 RepID=A0A010RZX5_9PEZI|nr:hypothetical protein CFIO01_02260 [Colletotrichum fioriniae PJ7]